MGLYWFERGVGYWLVDVIYDWVVLLFLVLDVKLIDWLVLLFGVDCLYLFGIIVVFGEVLIEMVLVVVVVVIVVEILILFDCKFCVYLWLVCGGVFFVLLIEFVL